ncbi:hypothetical protein ABG794_06150 [Enterobacter soli]|uniref:hypothetical protein n=1 Tax=Enterobacter soli TaxID=885040 RepID=UPI002148B691|nr:hypothetical protein [Enterobacter soli]MCR1315981.1 hypothetical protein [Enterobacter soli]HDR2471652.1 hypothetical protein [Enterobacter soli]
MPAIFGMIKDPYERKARLIPGLLVALPLIVPLISVYGAKNPILTSVIGLLSSCGAIFALANISRGLGKKLEQKLIVKWGGMPTTIVLRHRDGYYDSVTKSRYHQVILSKLGIQIPSPSEELADPQRADDIYIGITRRLRELTRNKKGLLLNDNISYGFHRNMVAMRIMGILSSSLGIVYGLIIAKVLTIIPPHFEIIHFANPGLAASMTLLISFILLTSWVFYFNEDSIKRIGFSYAERLFESLLSLRGVSSKRKNI